MTAPDPATHGLAEKVARAYWDKATGQAGSSPTEPPWEELPEYFRESSVAHTVRVLEAIRAAGLAVVELPEPDGQVDVVASNGKDTRTPYWKTSWGESVTAWIEGVETPVWELQEDLDAIRGDAAKMLAAVAACERFRAQRQGGDPR